MPDNDCGFLIPYYYGFPMDGGMVEMPDGDCGFLIPYYCGCKIMVIVVSTLYSSTIMVVSGW